MNCRLFLISCLIYLNSVLSHNIDCSYGVTNFHAVGDKYRCFVQNDFIIDSPENVQIETVSGAHMSGKTNDDDIYFHSDNKPLLYFPHGLEKFFKNLKGIAIWHTNLKEIHQDDLKAYPKLNCLSLSSTEIEVIEDGLFDFNPEMETVIFEKMKLFHISPTVFDNLSKLTTLYMGGNKCTNEASYIDRTVTLKVINSVKTTCTSSDFVNLNRKLENLEEISKNLNYANSKIFSQNLINFQTEFKESKIANYSTMKQKLQKLMQLKIKSPYEELINNFNGCEKLKQKIEQDLEDSQQNMLKAMDSKIEDLESRLTRKIEEILNEKLEKVMTDVKRIINML